MIRNLEPIWNIEVPKLAQMPLQILSTFLPIFPRYHGGGINSFTLLKPYVMELY